MKLNDKITNNRNVYGLGTGDMDYLDVNEKENYLQFKYQNVPVSFQSIIEFLNTNGLSSVVMRVPQLIDQQLSKLYNAFSKSFSKYNYPSLYRGVFPVKVNHNASILHSIANYGRNYGHGFEVGTKPELLIVLSLNPDPSSLIICNGTKDDDYLEAALTLTEKGYNIIISIESMRELNDLIHIARKRSIKPQIGLRIKMNQQVEGHWGHSSGLYSKFGFSANELSDIIQELKNNQFIEYVKLLHGHLGSQINKVNYFKRSVTELIGYFQYLFGQGAIGLRFINLGGGLGIDYESNSKPSESGVSYSFDDYADMIVSTIFECLKNSPEIIPPDIITESGRAITATSSMMLVEILENRKILPEINELPVYSTQEYINFDYRLKKYISKIRSLKQAEEVLVKFSNEFLEFQSKSSFWINLNNQKELELISARFQRDMLKRVKSILKKDEKELEFSNLKKFKSVYKLLTTFSEDLVGNFSVFRGACDVVLAKQYFPILPTRGLHSKAETLIRLVDITCDSDGEIAKFVTKINKKSLSTKYSSKNELFTKKGQLIAHPNDVLELNGIPMPLENTTVGSYVVIALTGAYQDTVQFDQNLLGALPEIELSIDKIESSFNLKIISQVEKNNNLITQMNHKISNVIKNLPEDTLEHLLYSHPYVNNKKPTNNIEIINTTKEPEHKISESIGY